ncbi:MAG: sulfate ABC transporter substrate-binding protein [archaeon]
MKHWMLRKDAVFAWALVLVVVVSGCTGNGGEKDIATITLYGFSVLEEVHAQRIIPGFQAYWKEKTGQDVNFETSFAGSGTITNQIIAGTPAEVAYLSHELDAIRLREAGRVSTDWTGFQHDGIVSQTPFIIVVRKGNPKGIQDWADLTNEGVGVIHADPSTSGGAMWSIYGMYGSVLKTGGSSEEAAELLRGVDKNVVSMPSSARKAMTTFEAGIGDALITYEEEALLAIRDGNEYEIVAPKSTIISENPVVIVDANVAEGERELVLGFIDYLWSEDAQAALGDYGFVSHYDSINAKHPELVTIEEPFKIDYLGGWEKAKADLIDGVWSGIQQEE